MMTRRTHPTEWPSERTKRRKTVAADDESYCFKTATPECFQTARPPAAAREHHDEHPPTVVGPPVNIMMRAPCRANDVSSSPTATESAAPPQRATRESDGVGHGSCCRSSMIDSRLRG